MIRTSLMYFIADLCLDRFFDPIHSALTDEVPQLNVGDKLKWVEFNSSPRNRWRMERCEVNIIGRTSGYLLFERLPAGDVYLWTSEENKWKCTDHRRIWCVLPKTASWERM